MESFVTFEIYIIVIFTAILKSIGPVHPKLIRDKIAFYALAFL